MTATMAPLVAELHIYPLKGAGGVRVPSVELDELGFRHDRRLLLVDGGGRFLSQREAPALALVRTTLVDGAVRLEAPHAGTLEVGLEPVGKSGRARRVQIWDDRVPAVDVGDEAARWAERALGREARLVRLARKARRAVDREHGRRGDRIAFVDGYPLLILSRASLEDLNRRLDRPVPMNRFRPNIVVSGTEAYEEDRWWRIRVDDVPVDVVKPCARCVVTTTDQETAERGTEPLRTLATYRKQGHEVMFGQNAIHRGRGTIREGAAVSVVERVEERTN